MNTPLNVEVTGTGPPLLLLHGAAPGATGRGNFGANVEALSRDFQVILADLPGSGGSPSISFRGTDHYGEYADLLVKQLDQMAIPRVHVLGMATGAGIGIAMSARHPGYVDKLIAVGPPGGRSAWHPSPSEGAKAMKRYFLGDGPSAAKMRAYLELTVVDPRLISEEIVEERFTESMRQWERIQQGEAPPKANASRILAHAPAATAKTLLVWGLQNRLQSATNLIDFLQALPAAEAHIYKDAGLWVPFEKATEFNTLVRDFLNSP